MSGRQLLQLIALGQLLLSQVFQLGDDARVVLMKLFETSELGLNLWVVGNVLCAIAAGEKNAEPVSCGVT